MFERLSLEVQQREAKKCCKKGAQLQALARAAPWLAEPTTLPWWMEHELFSAGVLEAAALAHMASAVQSVDADLPKAQRLYEQGLALVEDVPHGNHVLRMLYNNLGNLHEVLGAPSLR
ncbi:hypothetical protein CYMTET_39306 [Cymbomonas tetramitiformis]|uniref:Uncharacterized protein n=1 Tax=Cymbomonas tetramitiformis TaxID=36881 RepID=A0AAE0CAC0_9CHLO|nr:hypothetical protein CYMTET_39306 [Cymbomonas tetramitiformis]